MIYELDFNFKFILLKEDEMDRGAGGITTNSNNNNGNQSSLNRDVAKPGRRMDKLRRSLSFARRKKSKTLKLTHQSSSENSQSAPISTTLPQPQPQPQQSSPSSNNLPKSASTTAVSSTTATTATTSPPASLNKPALWIEDEKKVRSGNCTFQVKYLGSQEVAESRGMHMCEQAIEKLITNSVNAKKPIKAILHVSGDSLRVVDETNKTLLVDQTIEKVSFCAPDRHHDNGFAYICRDGTTRRWLCHGFMAYKDTLKGAITGLNGSGVSCSGGERLSHAVGCAFSVCLEKKQKRERENVSIEVGNNHTFTRFGSFRQASLTERLEDPQSVIPPADHVPVRNFDNKYAIERPKANPDAAFTRQNSLRGSIGLAMPFKRNNLNYSSLRPGELPSFQQQKINNGFNLNSPINESTSIVKSDTLNKSKFLFLQFNKGSH
jgi:hypothetical protein